MKPKKFLRLKKLLSHPEQFSLVNGTIQMSYGEGGFYEYLYESGDVEWTDRHRDW